MFRVFSRVYWRCFFWGGGGGGGGGFGRDLTSLETARRAYAPSGL